MDKAFKSRWINRKQLVAALLINAIFGAAAAFLVLNALNRGETWYIIGESTLINYIGVYLIGLSLAGAYFARDYYNIKALEITFTDKTIRFNRHYASKEFYLNDLNDFRVSSVIYGWFGFRKLIFRFKDRRDHRKYTTFLLLEKDEVDTFEKALVEARTKARRAS
ncbi:MAG: hypothetical protein ACLFUQ_01750 [Candidatus Izemoplasmataceae bacterium]